ncbi:hypothetical protein GWI33_008515 [Rhynchophorus ferrugineus]|uniref:Uncharacterized protein n=1 Tax=Rhynchophorus ferrugineus TaxID=354439 RepID=A0A834IBY2_RHYFE|nr:hypothetical protein GWI33_008515 [Rhynchophorus ferrugineus]
MRKRNFRIENASKWSKSTKSFYPLDLTVKKKKEATIKKKHIIQEHCIQVERIRTKNETSNITSEEEGGGDPGVFPDVG